MSKKIVALLAGGLFASAGLAQEITPVWVQHINGLVNVLPENKLPTLVKAGGTGDNTYNFDGTDVVDSYFNLVRYDDDHYLLGIRENGINENDAGLSSELKARAAAYPDRSVIWIDAKTGKPLGIALKTEILPVTLGAPDQSPTYGWWKWGIADGANGERAIYTGYKYKILRYAPAAAVTDPNFPNGRPTWSTTPTEAWVEPVPGELNPSFPPYVNKNDPAQVSQWVESSSGDGSASWRWKAFRVTGSGNNTKIYAGGGTWRASMNAQEFVTEDGGLTFYPIARLNDRGDGCGAKGNYALGGQPSSIRKTADGLEWCIQAHYPATGWTARPNRYVKAASGQNPCAEDPWYLCRTCSVGNSQTNQPARPNYFDPVEGAVGSLPAFSWEAAGKDGQPIENTVDGVQRYDGNWVMTSDTKDGVDYIVTYAIPSWDQQFGKVGEANAIFKPGWIGLHTMDGKIAKGNSEGKNNAFQIPVYETDEPIVDPNGNGGTGHDFGYDGDLEVYPDADGKGGALVLWAGGIYGFGAFHVQNVPAAITLQPASAAKTEGESITFKAAASGGANLYQWLKDGQPVPSATSPTFTIDKLKLADAGKYVFRVLNRLGNVDSTEATLSVVPDTVPPTISSLVAAENPSKTASWVTIVYSERVTPETAGNKGNYQLSGGVTISDVAVSSATAVMLKTTPLTPGTEYTLSVSNIKDQTVGNVMAANTQKKFTVNVTAGYLLWEFYPDIPGAAVDGLLSDANYPDNPSRREFITSFTTDPDLSNIAETFGARLSGWISPKESGNYRFFISSDDASQLWLSTSEDPALAAQIAEEPGCCNAFREPADDAPQTSAPQNLVGGKRYYIAALQKENGGGDYVKVAWRKEGDATPAAQLQPIAGEFLSSYRSVSAEPPAFAMPVLSGGLVTLTWSGSGTLEESTDFKAWTAVPGNPTSGYKVTPTGTQKFYRLTP